ncbi:MAG: cysteine desulfurase family protein [bacterium]|nr:cysteine desulfurase family protein [bacterium]
MMYDSRVYFDHNATTPVDPEVADVVDKATRELFGNPSSIHKDGRRARRSLDEARRDLSLFLNCNASEVFFTASGSESNNLAIIGAAYALKSRGSHLITSTVEHPSILKTFQYLEKQGWRVSYLKVDSKGRLDLEDLESSIRADTTLVSLMMANNETGVIFPVKEAAAIARKRGVMFHSDAVQAVGKIDVDILSLGLDMLSIAGHKLYAPKGIGALYVKEGLNISPIIHGGGQEFGLRAGTENLPGILGLARAAAISKSILADESARLKELKSYLKNGIERIFPEIVFNGSFEDSLPNTLSLSFKGISAESVIIAFDLEGFSLSAGSACASGAISRSHVLGAMGLDEETIDGTLRISLGRGNTIDEVERFLEVLPTILNRLN